MGGAFFSFREALIREDCSLKTLDISGNFDQISRKKVLEQIPHSELAKELESKFQSLKGSRIMIDKNFKYFEQVLD